MIARSLGSTLDARVYGCGEVGRRMGKLFIWMVHVRGLSLSCRISYVSQGGWFIGQTASIDYRLRMVYCRPPVRAVVKISGCRLNMGSSSNDLAKMEDR